MHHGKAELYRSARRRQANFSLKETWMPCPSSAGVNSWPGSISSLCRPTRFVQDFQRHHRRKPWRCQPITVSGWTKTRAERQSEYSFARQTQKG